MIAHFGIFVNNKHTMGKKEQLKQLKNKMANDKMLPLRKTANKLVFGEGSVNPKIYFLGEAPGRREDETGLPFVGRAGKLLDELIASVGLVRKQVYITSVVRYRPPKNRYPLPSEVRAFEPYVNKELDLIKPKLVMTLGRLALEKFIPNGSITNLHGRPVSFNWNGLKFMLVPMYHPAAGLRNPKFKLQLFRDFKKTLVLVK